MPEADDFAERLTTLEEQVAQLQHTVRGAEAARVEAAAARILASGAYEEVGEMRTKLDAHTRTLNALRETQLEQGERLATLETKFDGLDNKVDRLDNKVNGLETKVNNLETKVDHGFSTLQVGMSQITALLTTVIRQTGDEGSATT